MILMVGDRSRTSRNKPKKIKPEFHEREKRLIYVASTAIVFALALLTLLVGGAKTPLASCSGIILQQQRYSCLSKLALSTRNANVCSYIDSAQQSDSCITAIAVATTNATMCQRINMSRASYSSCVFSIATATKSSSYCSMLADPSRSSCVFSVAQANGFGNINDCSVIINGAQKSNCMGLFYYNSAVRMKNATYCRMLTNATNSTLMPLIIAQNLSGVNSFNVQAFSYATLNVSPRNYCYYRLATITGSRILCGFTNGLLAQSCNYTFSHFNATLINSTNVSVACSSTPSSFRSLCAYSVLTGRAVIQRNITICTQINSTQYMYSCILSLAERYNYSSYCSYIKNGTYQQACYISVRSRTNTTK